MTDDSTGRDRALMIWLGVVGVVLLLVSVLIGLLLDAAPGSIAEWLAAVATLAALLAAAYAAIQTARTFRLEQLRDQRRDVEDRQRQAVQVAVWGGEITHRGPEVSFSFSGQEPTTFTQAAGVVVPESIPVTIRNASQLPVFKLTVDVYIGDPQTETPVNVGRHPIPGAIVATISGVEIVTPALVESMSLAIARRANAADTPSPISIGWTFQDIAGVTWRRVPGAGLTELAAPRR